MEFLIGILFGIIIGMVLHYIVLSNMKMNQNKTENSTGEWDLFSKTPIKEKHLEPQDICYEGGFADTTECYECGNTGLYWDNNSGICRNCGGDLIDAGAAKWDIKDGMYQWVKPNQ